MQIYARFLQRLIKYLLPRKDRENILGILNDEQVSTIASYLFYAGIDLLDNYRSFHPNSEQIHETFERFIKSWNAVSISETAIFPLINFKSNQQDAIQIGRSYSISPFVSKEKTVFWDIVDEFHSRDSFSYFNFQQIGYKLSGTRVYPYPERSNLDENSIGIEIGISQNTMLMEVRDILSALRLNKEGDVAVTNYIEQSDEVLPRRNTSMGRPELGFMGFQARRNGTTYVLDEQDLSLIGTIFDSLRRLDKQPNQGELEIGLRRFNQSYGRIFYEDHLIDLTVALESALLGGIPSHSELKYRFCLLGAALLGNVRDPKDTHKFLSTMYDARSKVVHGGKSLGAFKPKELDNSTPENFIGRCEEITRLVLREYVLQIGSGTANNVSSLNKKLEEKIIDKLK